MPSLFDIMAKPAVAVLMSHFKERTQKLGYRPPGVPAAAPLIEWDAIVLEENFQPVFDSQTGQTSIRIVRTALVPTDEVIASHITEFQPRAVLTFDGYEWTLDEPTSKWTSNFVTFGMSRQPLVRKNELRRAAV